MALDLPIRVCLCALKRLFGVVNRPRRIYKVQTISKDFTGLKCSPVTVISDRYRATNDVTGSEEARKQTKMRQLKPGELTVAVEEYLQFQKWKTRPAPRAFTCDGLERLSF